MRQIKSTFCGSGAINDADEYDKSHQNVLARNERRELSRATVVRNFGRGIEISMLIANSGETRHCAEWGQSSDEVSFPEVVLRRSLTRQFVGIYRTMYGILTHATDTRV